MIILGCIDIKLVTRKRRVIEQAKTDKIAAVKLHRELYGSDLKTALDTVNRWIGYKPCWLK